MNTALRGPFGKWVSRSLLGHIVFCQLFCSIPAFVVLVPLNVEDGTLTAAWLARLATVWCIAGLVLALVVWYAFTLPIMKRRGRTR